MKNLFCRVCLLSLLSASSNADVALRIVCSAADEGADIYINDKKEGTCSNDFIVPAGNISLKAHRLVGNDKEQIFEKNFSLEDGDVDKIRVTLSEPKLTKAAIDKKRIATIKFEMGQADSALKKARQGDISAMEEAAKYYANGTGLDKSQEKANYWKQKAIDTTLYNEAMKTLSSAEAGDIAAMENIATIYQEGKGLSKDIQKAQYWNDKKAVITQANQEQHAKEILARAEQGNIDAMTKMAGLYQTGNGVPKNTEQANEWQLKAAQATERNSRREASEKAQQELEDHSYFEISKVAFDRLFFEAIDDGDYWVITFTPSTTFYGALGDLFCSPAQTSQHLELKNRIEAHAVNWGAPNSMVAKAYRQQFDHTNVIATNTYP